MHDTLADWARPQLLMAVPSFKRTHLETMARAIVDALSHRDVTNILADLAIAEAGGTPRWERVLLALEARQARDGCGNNVGAFLEAALDPARFTQQDQEASTHDSLLTRINQVLAFSGFRINPSGKLETVPKATTLTEAHQRASRLKQDLVARRVHPNVLRFCRAELLEDNYFHAVLEATKSVADAIRSRAGLSTDGADLVNEAFGGKQPRLALTSLQTEAQRGEQRGFVNLLVGFFGTFRNPTAHAPRVSWPMAEQDALDLLTLASYLHRRIEGSHRTGWEST